MATKGRMVAHNSDTFINGLLRCMSEAMKKEGLRFTEEEKRRLACLLISLAHRITDEEYKMTKPWPLT